MGTKTRVGTMCVLAGLALLVIANQGGSQTTPARKAASAAPRAKPAAPSNSDLFRPLTKEERERAPTIFEALLSVIDSTDEGKAIDKNQRDRLRQELIETNKHWRKTKTEMKEAIRQANRRFVVDPHRDAKAVPPKTP